MFGGVAMIDGLNRQLKNELGKQTKVIATGGLANIFFTHLETVETVEPTLTLDGLQIIFERCVSHL